MIEDHEGATTRDVVRIIGLPLRFQPLDFGLKLAEPRIHIVGEFLGRLMLLRQPIECRLCRYKRGLIFRRKINRMRVGSPHAVRLRKIKMGFRPIPALGGPHGIGLTAELCGYQEIEHRHILQIAAAILGEKIAKDCTACFGVGLDPDKARAAVGGGHVGFGEHAADGAGIPVIGQALIDAFLPGMIIGDGKGHQLF